MSVLETQRLILRPLKEGDAEMMYRNWTSDERVAKYCRWYAHETIETTEELLKMYLDEAASGFEFRWGIALKENGELIGCIDVIAIEDEDRTAEIGYVLSHGYWGKGIMTEAVGAVIKELWKCGFIKIKAVHADENTASGRVMEKCGMKFTHFSECRKKFGSEELVRIKCYEIVK